MKDRKDRKIEKKGTTGSGDKHRKEKSQHKVVMKDRKDRKIEKKGRKKRKAQQGVVMKDRKDRKIEKKGTTGSGDER